MTNSVLIACDESGAEGENVVGARNRVFTHGSVNLDLPVAEAVISELRRRAPSRSLEYKSEQLLRPGNRDALLWLLGADGPLGPHAHVCLVEKEYFAVGKVIDLLVEELAHESGIDLYTHGTARELALTMYRDGRRALGEQAWTELLESFNSLMRARQRQGIKATVEDFFGVVDHHRFKSRRRNVEQILELIWRARSHAQAFQDTLAGSKDHLPALDPLVAGLASTAHHWYFRTGGPIAILHDQQSMLTPSRVAEFILMATQPLAEFRRLIPPVYVTDIQQVDSKDDPRIQVADLLAGVARSIAENELVGKGDPALAAALRPFIGGDSLWEDQQSWSALAGH